MKYVENCTGGVIGGSALIGHTHWGKDRVVTSWSEGDKQWDEPAWHDGTAAYPDGKTAINSGIIK